MRQGCVISPALFNLFINELPLSFDPNKCDPFTLPNGEKLNCLLYADDLVILSKSKQGLANCLKTLENFNTKWLLSVNFKKTKIVIFQKSGRKPKDLSFSINENPIEIVQEYTYLGVKITSSGSFDLCQKGLAEKALNAFYKIHKQLNFSLLSLNSAQKIFDAVIVPILTYGCEVWGIFTKLDFEKWDRTPNEKVHLRFCKTLLGLNRKASNHAARGDLGRYPLQIMILKRILNYILYLNSKEHNSVVKQMFFTSQKIECLNSYFCNFLKLARSLSPKPFKAPSLTNELVHKIINNLNLRYENFWLQKLQNSSKLDFYREIKKSFRPEQYVNVPQCCQTKRDFAKFRTSNHSLAVETLRYCNPIVPRNERLCLFCNKKAVEDELHILLVCESYSDYRKTLFQKLNSINTNIDLGNEEEFIKLIFSTTNTKITYYLSNYISKCLSKRKSLLPLQQTFL